MSNLSFPRQNIKEQRQVSEFPSPAPEAGLLLSRTCELPAGLPTPGHHILKTILLVET